MIILENITKTFSNQETILNGASLRIEEGEMIRISGANGCGKSTLLKIACKLMKADSGEVRYEKYEEEIGALIENPAFVEDDTLLYNLKFLFNLKNKFDETTVKSLCERYGLNLYNKTKMKKYSVGMRQKAGLIQAVMEDQKIIYLDEPTRGLDEHSVDVFYDHIKELHENKKTIIICSHEPLDQLIFDKEYVLQYGRIIEKK